MQIHIIDSFFLILPSARFYPFLVSFLTSVPLHLFLSFHITFLSLIKWAEMSLQNSRYRELNCIQRHNEHFLYFSTFTANACNFYLRKYLNAGLLLASENFLHGTSTSTSSGSFTSVWVSSNLLCGALQDREMFNQWCVLTQTACGHLFPSTGHDAIGSVTSLTKKARPKVWIVALKILFSPYSPNRRPVFLSKGSTLETKGIKVKQWWTLTLLLILIPF